jgi:sugar O-acyltransferase (sialic acid O-acetyltransferase NeuD family)
MEKRWAIIGAGGLGKEVLCCLGDTLGWDDLNSKFCFLVEQEYFSKTSVFGINILPLAYEHTHDIQPVIAIGDLNARIRIQKLLLETHSTFPSVIHRSVIVTPYTTIGHGSIVMGNTLISCDVTIGEFAILNPGSTISHDCSIGTFFTAAPGVTISGGCSIGDRVVIGTNACIKNGIHITNDVVIGMGAVVIKDILSPGTYVGNPAHLI